MDILLRPNESVSIGIADSEHNFITIVYHRDTLSSNIVATAELEGNIKGKGIIYHQKDDFE